MSPGHGIHHYEQVRRHSRTTGESTSVAVPSPKSNGHFISCSQSEFRIS